MNPPRLCGDGGWEGAVKKYHFSSCHPYNRWACTHDDCYEIGVFSPKNICRMIFKSLVNVAYPDFIT